MAIARENDKEKEKERAKEHDGGEEDGGEEARSHTCDVAHMHPVTIDPHSHKGITW